MLPLQLAPGELSKVASITRNTSEVGGGEMKQLYAFFALAIVILAASAGARADTVSDVLGCTGDPCVVSFNGGGEIESFQAAAREAKRTGRRVVINGPCLSACAIFADVARSRVCITSKAKFGFHKGYVLDQPTAGGRYRLVKRFTPSHSRDITNWVKNNGGFPTRGFNFMRASAAKQIWHPC